MLDLVGGTIGRQAFEVTANGHGRIGVYGASSGDGITIETPALARRGVAVVGALGIAMAMMEQEQVMRANVDFVLAEATDGRLTAVIGQTYPLERAPRPTRPWRRAGQSEKCCSSLDECVTLRRQLRNRAASCGTATYATLRVNIPWGRLGEDRNG